MKTIIKITMFLLIVSNVGCMNYGNNKKFDKEKWINGSYRDRGRMINYMIDHRIILGKKPNDVLELLGKSDDDYMVNIEDTIDGEKVIYNRTVVYIVDRGDMFTYDMHIYFSRNDNRAKSILFDD